jgi:hypothetical protein
MPTGVVVFAGNNARKKGWAYRATGGKLIGYLTLDSENRPLGLPVPGDATKKKYTAVSFYGLKIELLGPVKLSKGGSEVTTTSGAPAGKVAKESLVDANGKLQMRSDSTGMFEPVALKLQKLYSLPKSLVKEFLNVHDDFEDGGTAEQSRKNFFAALKEAPGPGGASELDFFAYVGHGEGSALPSAGVTRSHIAALAKEIKRLVRADGTVIFYACQTGSKDGLAQKLSGLLPSMTVWGHRKSGPASTNPYKKKYVGGVEQPFRDSWGEADQLKWDTYMRASADFYARYPFMTLDQLIAEVGLSLPTTTAPTAKPAAQTATDPKKRGWNPLRGFQPAAVH